MKPSPSRFITIGHWMTHQTSQAALLQLLLLVIFFWPVFITGQVILPSDLVYDDDPLWQAAAPPGFREPANALLADQVNQFYPWQQFIERAISQRQIPLWNPYVGGGYPFIGNAQSGFFDPFTLIGRLWQFPYSMTATLFFRLFCAGLFTYLFARAIQVKHPGALLAMITFAFSSPVVVWAGYPLLSVMVWLPALLWATENLLRQQKGQYWLYSSLIIAAQFLGGHPETSFLLLLTWFIYTLYRLIFFNGWSLAILITGLKQIVSMLLLGSCLSAIQLLPFLETLWHSAAFAARTAEASTSLFDLRRLLFDWSAWPSGITLILPDYFGTPTDNSYWFPTANYNELIAYVGLLPLFFALAISLHCLKTRTQPHRALILFLSVTALVMFGVALNFPLLNLVNQLPIFSISNNGRLRLVFALFVAIIAGYGLDYFAGQQRYPNIMRWGLVGVGLGSVALVAVTYVGFVLYQDTLIQNGYAFIDSRQGTPYLAHPIEHYYRLIEQRQARKLTLYHPENWRMYLPILTAITFLGLRYFETKRTHFSAHGWAAIIIALVIIDLFSVNLFYNPTTPKQAIFPKTEAIRFLQQDTTIHRVSATGPILNPNRGMIFGLADIRGYDPMLPRRYVSFINQMAGFFPIGHHLLFTQADSPLLDLLNVKYLLTDQPLAGKWQPVFSKAGQPTIYQNSQVWPRAFLVNQAIIVEDEAASLWVVATPDFDFRQTVVLETEPMGWAPSAASEQTTPPPVGIESYRANEIRLIVNGPQQSILVLTDTYMPGWQATIDGRNTPIYVANHAFRAIVVPAGLHEIRFVYRPASLGWGAGLTLLGLVFVGGMGVCHFMRRGDALSKINLNKERNHE